LSVFQIAVSQSGKFLERLSFHPQRDGITFLDVMRGVAQNPNASRQAQMNVLAWAVQEENEYSIRVIELLSQNSGVLPAVLESAAFAVRQRWSKDAAARILDMLCESPNAPQELLRVAAAKTEDGTSRGSWNAAGLVLQSPV